LHGCCIYEQETEGGYTGNDLTKLAELLEVTSRGLRKRLSFWIKTDKQFSEFIYLGKEKPTVTLYEFFKIEHELASNPIQVKFLAFIGLPSFTQSNTSDKSAPFQVEANLNLYSADYRLTFAFYHILYPLCLRNSLQNSYPEYLGAQRAYQVLHHK
jgi:hypothetical protein